MTRVGVVLPVANQADHIERVVEAYLRALDEIVAVEFVLAVNNSRDDSLASCRRLAEAHPERVSVVATPAGWGNAVIGGLRTTSASVIGFANSARTHDVDLLRGVRCALEHRDALVKGRRTTRAYSPLRRFGSRMYNAECRAFFGIESADINGNPKIWHRTLLPPELLSEPGSFLDAEVLIHARQRGLPVLEFPIVRMDRHGGESMTTLRLASTLYARPVAVKLSRGRELAASHSG